MARDALKNLPNIVSLLRLPMAAAFPFLQGVEERLLLIAAAAATDFLDGFIARKRGSTTRFGALIDPLADRCFVLVAVTVLWYESTLTAVATFVLVSRDIAVVGAWLATRFSPHLRNFKFVARPAGKVVTALQLTALAVAYLFPGMLTASVVLVAIASAVSIFDYSIVLWNARAA